ncbi:hypothetical protein KCP73_23850 [Salmonella enterica subsp. enterica]|nr:hypothetical protein KCP73_23850 [Salmonella enterica subsp. enterica]
MTPVYCPAPRHPCCSADHRIFDATVFTTTVGVLVRLAFVNGAVLYRLRGIFQYAGAGILPPKSPPAGRLSDCSHTGTDCPGRGRNTPAVNTGRSA